ncbi:hypothetical protein GCM10009665_60750 [Kitasatospora nipponensis]|uniref:Uncharacterized protein n=1 Tax=Kitasatospora nipponensis TaxID=258049 RepID=A0ABN1WUK9_9ACTN
MLLPRVRRVHGQHEEVTGVAAGLQQHVHRLLGTVERTADGSLDQLDGRTGRGGRGGRPRTRSGPGDLRRPRAGARRPRTRGGRSRRAPGGGGGRGGGGGGRGGGGRGRGGGGGGAPGRGGPGRGPGTTAAGAAEWTGMTGDALPVAGVLRACASDSRGKGTPGPGMLS